jgi:5,10-methenyltetrahydrofolate synthetase
MFFRECIDRRSFFNWQVNNSKDFSPDMSEKNHEKTTLRRALLAVRNAASGDLRAQWDAAIRDRLLAWHNRNPVNSIGVYWPIRNEPDLHILYAELAKRQVRLALPLVVAKDAPLKFAAWVPGDAVIVDAMGIAIPANPVVFAQPEAVLIPCVGFNSANIRLGYGGGFYDRTLASSPRPIAVGIAYECGREEFVSESHDISLDLIVTERSEQWFRPEA